MLERILPVLLLLLVLPDLYICLHLLKTKRYTTTLRVLWWLPSVVLAVIGLILASVDEFTPDHLAGIGQYLVWYFLIVIPKCLFAFCSLTGWGIQVLSRTKQNYGNYVGSVLAAFGFYMMLAGATFDRNNFQVKQLTFTSPDLPEAFDGYRIVQFSDLHAGTFRKGHEKDIETIVNLVNAQKGDIIVFTGDVVNHRAEELDGFERQLSRLHAPDGVYSIMGNHDYSMYIHWKTEAEHQKAIRAIQNKERSFGWRLLLNERVMLHRGNDSIALLGSENDGYRHHFPHRGNLPKMLDGIEGLKADTVKRPRLFKVLISHDPTQWRKKILPESDIQLMLSGHTHGMQFELFGFSPAKWLYPEWGGLYTEGNQSLYVSLGVGEVMIPFRFGALPEVNVITLKRTK